jgi:uncharacterized protein YndB with AHSA1/START domain
MISTNLTINREAQTIVMSRVFSATPDRLWRIYTDPALVSRWWGPRALTTVVDTMDVRVGGKWRFVQHEASGESYAFRGEYQVVDPPNLLVATFEFEPMAGHVITEWYRFEAQPGGKTLVTVTSHFASVADLDGMVQSGMESGAIETFERLEELILELD